jgi:hypothetical protein
MGRGSYEKDVVDCERLYGAKELPSGEPLPVQRASTGR